MKKEIEQIADYYGVYHQATKTIEELGELIVAIAKQRNGFFDDRGAIVTEIADVEIMLAQLKGLLGIEEKVAVEKEYKIARQLRRIQEEELVDGLIKQNYERS